MTIYNTYNEIVCDYNCENCDIADSCTDRIDGSNTDKNIENFIEAVK